MLFKLSCSYKNVCWVIFFSLFLFQYCEMNFAWSLKIYGWHKVIPLCWSVGRHVEVLSRRCRGEKMGKIWIWKILNGKYLKNRVKLLLHDIQSKYFQLCENLQLGTENWSYRENLPDGTLLREANSHLSMSCNLVLLVTRFFLGCSIVQPSAHSKSEIPAVRQEL